MNLMTVQTEWGWVGLAFSSEGMAGLVLPQSSRDQAWHRLVTSWPAGLEAEPVGSAEIVRKLQRYFEGKVVSFDVELDLRGNSPFFQHVWNVVSRIPYGYVFSYAQVAEMAGRARACRAVGNAMAANPVPIVVPCHRVIRSDGTLGNYADDPDIKRRLLEMERKALES